MQERGRQIVSHVAVADKAEALRKARRLEGKQTGPSISARPLVLNAKRY